MAFEEAMGPSLLWKGLLALLIIATVGSGLFLSLHSRHHLSEPEIWAVTVESNVEEQTPIPGRFVLDQSPAVLEGTLRRFAAVVVLSLLTYIAWKVARQHPEARLVYDPLN